LKEIHMSAVKTERSTSEKTRQLPYVVAITEGVREVLKEQPNAFVAGEDVAQAGSVYGYYRGILAEFGPDRIYDTPISEKGIIGLGVGAAATGCRPVLDIMFMDFLGECMDEVANQMAKMRFMFGGSATLPITVLTMAGAGANLAAQHSQSLEAWLAHLPGVKVVMPATPYDAKGLIIAAARDDNPVFVVLNKMSLALPGPVPEGAYEVPIGKANVVRAGRNYTIVTIGRMLHEATKAAKTLEGLGIDAEVIDARSIQPFDTDTVVASVKKTHRAMIVHEAVRFGGFGAEIAAQIQELAFDWLDAPVARVGAPFSPVPFSPALEKHYVPNAERIVAAVREQLGV
jgi:pyruvate dehydrogenase E1 component beta subunit